MKLFSRINRHASAHPHGNGFFSRIGDDALVDWVLMLIVSGLVALALVSCAVITYTSLDTRLADGGAAGVYKRPASVNTVKLNAILDAFDHRANERAMIKNGYSGPSDPSL